MCARSTRRGLRAKEAARIGRLLSVLQFDQAMQTIHDRNRLIGFLKSCIECSIYIAPTDPGLTFGELVEAGRSIGLLPGEISDAMSHVTTEHGVGGRLMPGPNDTALWLIFYPPEVPDYRNPKAFDFVFAEMHEPARVYGAQGARLERTVIVERGNAAGLSRNDVQIAVTMMVLNGILVEQEGILRYARGREGFATPTTQLAQQRNFPQTRRNESRERAYAAVKDVIARRSDGRPKSAEPFEAFAEALESLGTGPFRVWWNQMVAELRQASTQTAPVTVTTLSAALVEASLTFVVAHAQALGLGVMGSKAFAERPSRWKLEELATSAGYGGEAAILDKSLQTRVSMLISARQRIHAGRMLEDFPSGPPDLQPEKARDALLTAEQVVRSVLDWLGRYPSKS